MLHASRLIIPLALSVALSFAEGLQAADAPKAADASNPAFAVASERTKAELAIAELAALADRGACGYNETWGQVDAATRTVRDALQQVINSDVGRVPATAETLRKRWNDLEATQRDRDAERGRIEVRYASAINLNGVVHDAFDCLARVERDSKDLKMDLAPVLAGYQTIAAKAGALRDQAAGALKDLQAQREAWKATGEEESAAVKNLPAAPLVGSDNK